MGASDVIAETDRVILRPWRLDEADRFFDMHRRMEVARWIGGRPMADCSEAEPVIRRMLDQLAADPRFATEAARALLARGFALGLAEIWAVTDPQNQQSVRVCEKLGMRLLGATHRWYHELSLMFWMGAHEDQQPTISPDGPAPV